MGKFLAHKTRKIQPVNSLHLQTRWRESRVCGGGWAIAPHPVLPQIPNCTEFGEGEHEVGMNIFINAQAEIVLSPFSSRCFFAGCKWGKLEGGKYAA